MGNEDYEIVQTCGACPEQYDVFKGGELVAYLRLRNGYFYASVPDVGGKIVFESDEMKGDGIFENGERVFFISRAIKAVKNHYEAAGVKHD